MKPSVRCRRDDWLRIEVVLIPLRLNLSCQVVQRKGVVDAIDVRRTGVVKVLVDVSTGDI